MWPGKLLAEWSGPVQLGVVTERLILGYGVDRVVHETARRLVALGYDVTVFALNIDGTYVDAPYRVVNLARLRKPEFGLEDLGSVAFRELALARLRSEVIDLWLLQTPPFYSWAADLTAPVICVEHGTPPGHFFSGPMGESLDAMTRHRFGVLYPALRLCDGVVAISTAIQVAIQAGLPGPMRAELRKIYNGSDHHCRADPVAVAALRQELGLREQDRLLLWMGRLDADPEQDHPYKGLMSFLKLAQRLRARHPGLVCLAAGRGSEDAEPLLDRHGVLALRNVPDRQLGLLYAAADLLVNTSLWEGFNLPLVEAQAQGTPVIAYDCWSHPEVVANGLSGVLVATQAGPEGMEAAIEDLLTKPERLRELAANAGPWAHSFRWDDNVMQLRQLIDCCLARAANGGV
ncbi:MAG: glycosyltransferase family 4 protein [Cyanobium sp.]